MSLILSGTDGLSDVDGSASTPAIRGTDTNTGIFFPAADTIAFAEGGAESMRLDSNGNLAIGTTTAQISGAGRGNITLNGSSSAIINLSTGDVNKAQIFHGGTDMFIGNQANGYLMFQTNATERMRIDSSGNIYVGNDTTCNLTDFRTKSLSSSGYQRIAGGLILQWVQVTTTTATSGTASFSWPITFPSSCFMGAPACNVNDSGELGSSISTTGGTLNFAAYSGASKTFTIFGVGN